MFNVVPLALEVSLVTSLLWWKVGPLCLLSLVSLSLCSIGFGVQRSSSGPGSHFLALVEGMRLLCLRFLVSLSRVFLLRLLL